MRMYDIIMKKRDGGVLDKAEIEFFVKEYTRGEIPDYQASALMMAIFLRGMSDEETAQLTEAMAVSGDTLDLSEFGELSCDKHSTGGVGDKTSLIVAPIVASLGGCVTKMSGRGLGHTGGTVDKLEAIPGYRTTLEEKEFIAQVKRVGMAVIGQSGELAPCDKKLYALRDVTATVDSIPLITSSIMSKKIASGSKNIVLDVKFGNGAFMKTAEDACTLAESMVRIGKMCSRNIAALITDMNTPLGNNIGNSLEVKEAVEILKSGRDCDLKRVSVALAAKLVSLMRRISIDEALEAAEDAISSGRAFEKMKEWVGAQGGDIRYLEDTSLFEESRYEYAVHSERDGYITEMLADEIGICASLLGAGRVKKEDSIDLKAGIILEKKTGDSVKRGDVLCRLYTDKPEAVESVTARYLNAVVIGERKPEEAPLIYKIID